MVIKDNDLFFNSQVSFEQSPKMKKKLFVILLKIIKPKRVSSDKAITSAVPCGRTVPILIIFNSLIMVKEDLTMRIL